MTGSEINIRYLVEREEAERSGSGFISILESYLGREDADRVMSVFGGTVLSIPASINAPAYEQLSARIGSAVAQRLIQMFQGESLYIPNGYHHTVHMRNCKILERLYQRCQSGETKAHAIRAVALEMGISERTVLRVVAAYKSRKEV